MPLRHRSLWRIGLGLSVLAAVMLTLTAQSSDPLPPGPPAEFHFLRLQYTDYRGTRVFRRGWWMQDWPEADIHFTMGIERLTRIHIGNGRHVRLTDPELFDYPWIYATQVGFWDLSDAETAKLREYLLRGGFLMADDFHGPQDWERFRQTMDRVLPGEPIVDMQDGDAILNVLYSIKERVLIPGMRHVRRGPGGSLVIQPTATPDHWRVINDPKGRAIVAINFNMDVGDAWEHADTPEYPEQMTSLAYRVGINYILYAMTH